MCLHWLHSGMSTNLYSPRCGCLSFVLFILGFDAVTTLSNETKQPTKNIPRAVMLTTLAGGLFFTAAWFIQLYFPNNLRFQHPSEALPEIVLYVGGAFPIRILMRANYEHCRLGPCLTCQRFTFTVYNGHR